jgi:23S rRNA (cytosine1962-C5)-methyltransferase
MNLPPLRLKPREHHRLRAGHLWVFSNEVDIAATPLTGFEPGQTVRIEDAAGQALGVGYVNPHALICARLVARDQSIALDQALIVRRLEAALALRARLHPEPYYRLAFGEGDGLPGLVVDRYGDILVAQLNTAGMERLKAEIVAAFEQLLKPRAVLLRNDSPIRALEGLPAVVETTLGTVPEEIELVENGARFEVPLAEGQKTGWYYDQRANRTRFIAYARGARVLDAFSYLGAFGIEAAVAGAATVLCLDSSARAVAGARRNAARNGVDDRVAVEQADVFERLRGLRREGAEYDLVALDPPALVKRRKDLKEGAHAYRRLNALALELLAPGGVLVTASCSYHMSGEQLLAEVLTAARRAGLELQLLEQGHQGPDHPIHPAIPETGYLKAFFLRRRPE